MKQLLFLLIIGIFLQSCIGDDFVLDTVDPVLRITNTVDTIGLNETFQFESMYLNNIGVEEAASITWQSSNSDIISIDENGLATALSLGSSVISAEVTTDNTSIRTEKEVYVGDNTVEVVTMRGGVIRTTSSYKLEGSFQLETSGEDLILSFADDYEASTALPGLYIYLTNNASTTSNALEIGAVEIFSGEHAYTIPNVGLNDYSHVLYFCKPFNVKVGDGEIL